MLGISTSWLSSKIESGAQLIREMLSLGTEAIELEYRITDQVFHALKPLLRKEQLAVLSVHNFFPVPDIAKKGSGDVFLFTSDDDEERKRAIKYTLQTIQHASDVQAKAVVLHLGSVPLKADLNRLYELYDEGRIGTDEAITLRQNLKDERQMKAKKYFDRVLSSLDKLIPAAEKFEITLGVENRYHYHEIPSFEEIGRILEEFRRDPIAYWHDVGHALNSELTGFAGQKDFLDRYASKMIGMHLHDAKGREDHFAPGTGGVDFRALKPYLKDETIKVIEVHPKVSRAELLAGIKHLKASGI